MRHTLRGEEEHDGYDSVSEESGEGPAVSLQFAH
jgi:hypothetical protein